MKSGANPAFRDSEGKSALDYARKEEFGKAFVKLLEYPGDETYFNRQFRYSVSFPRTTLVGRGESGSGDGQVFESPDGSLTVAVWGIFNVRDQTIAERCKEEPSKEMTTSASGKDGPFVITYRFLNDTVCVLSGVRADETVVYQKTGLADNIFRTIRLEYPLEQKQTLDPLVNRIVASFQSWPEPQGIRTGSPQGEAAAPR